MLNLTTTNLPCSTGDLIPLMEDIGADLVGMDFIQCNPGCPPGRKQRIILRTHLRIGAETACSDYHCLVGFNGLVISVLINIFRAEHFSGKLIFSE